MIETVKAIIQEGSDLAAGSAKTETEMQLLRHTVKVAAAAGIFRGNLEAAAKKLKSIGIAPELPLVDYGDRIMKEYDLDVIATTPKAEKMVVVDVNELEGRICGLALAHLTNLDGMEDFIAAIRSQIKGWFPGVKS
jgi:hypothetical protein